VAPAPFPYQGTFFLDVEGAGSIPLASFAGCYDRILGMEYEDCYFTIGRLANSVTRWLDDSVSGTDPHRDVAVIQVDQFTGQILSRTDIGSAFLRDFTVSDFDASDNTVGFLSFVVVPGSLQMQAAPGGAANPVVAPTLRRNLFGLSLDGANHPGVFAVRGLHVSFAKLLVAGTGRRQFHPGQPQFDDLLVEVGQQDVQTHEQWVSDVAAGNLILRTGEIALIDQVGHVVGAVGLTDLLPLAFPPYFTASGGRRTLVLDLARFQFQ
jgi:hypothetical protein